MLEQINTNQEDISRATAPTTSIQSKITLGRFRLAVDHFRGLANDLPLQNAYIMVLIAVQPGITVKELMAKTNLSHSSCSRNLAMLSKINRYDEPGLDVIEARPDPTDSRRYKLFLTPKGEEFMVLLMDILR